MVFPDNLRATVNECLYSFPQANVAVSSPCSIDYACLPLQTALTSNFLNSTTDTRYGYCTADKSAWQGSALAPCVSCLQATTDQSYLANCSSIPFTSANPTNMTQFLSLLRLHVSRLPLQEFLSLSAELSSRGHLFVSLHQPIVPIHPLPRHHQPQHSSQWALLLG